MKDHLVLVVVLIMVCSATLVFFDPEVPDLLMGPTHVEYTE